jgi:crotonobetainyl-CoA:carnitine CoA-transferase CaiB-like acyl-CoA transferase
MGARCTKLEGPAGDPMGHYLPAAYAQMHEGVKVAKADLKTEAGQKKLHALLARTDVLLTSFRPSALNKLGLGWKALHKAYPQLNLVAIVGAPGARAEEPGHDLTYMADNGLVTGLDLPPSLFADMGGALMASEATLQAVLLRQAKGKGVQFEVALSEAARWLALPRHWGLTLPQGSVGGAHAGYRVYPCKDGRVAVAALEPHFAAALCEAAQVPVKDMRALLLPATHSAIAAFLAGQTRKQLDKLAVARDIPLHTLPR